MKKKEMETILLNPIIVKRDAQQCIIIPKKIGNMLDKAYKIYEKDGKIILDPIKEEIHEREQWLLDPKNQHIIDQLNESFKEEKRIDFDEFKKTLKLK